MTDEDVPSAPPDVRVSEETSTSALVTWARPLRPNGVIAGYRLYFLHANLTEVVTVQSRDTTVSHQLRRLRPASTYQVWVKAFTPQHEGQPSGHTALATEPSRPAVPRAVSLRCGEAGTLTVAWRGEAQVFMVQVGESQLTVMGQEAVVANLSLDTEYLVRLRGGVGSVHRPGEMLWGAWSEESRARLGSGDCVEEEVVPLTQAVLAGGLGTLLLLATVVTSLLLYRRFCTESYYYLEEASVGSSPSTKSLSTGQPSLREDSSMTPAQFLLHLDLVHREERAGLRAELASVMASLQPGQESSDWVEGWRSARQYLVPGERLAPHTVWQAVLREGVALVVELEEDCPAYWPEVGGLEHYGQVEVACLARTRLGSHCLRRLRVGEREVVLLQLVTAPAPLSLLTIARAARTAGGKDGRALVLGRGAGLYTVLDSCLRQLRAEGTVGAGAVLRRAAGRGRVLVAREEELSLLLTTLGEAVCAGETCVRRAYLPRYIAGLVAGEGEALARQWSLVVGRSSSPAPSSLAPGATWLPGLQSSSEFLLASPPCPEATPQFWRLLWDCGVHTVLVLGAGVLQGCAGEEGITVTHWEDELSSQGRAQNYVLEDMQGARKVVKLLQQDSFLAPGSVPEPALALADCIHSRQDQLARAPLLLVGTGPEPAGAYCALSTLLRQLELEQAVDVYTVARGIESLLPGAFPSPGSLLRLYRCVSLSQSKNERKNLCPTFSLLGSWRLVSPPHRPPTPTSNRRSGTRR